jgi:hypothetical protein
MTGSRRTAATVYPKPRPERKQAWQLGPPRNTTLALSFAALRWAEQVSLLTRFRFSFPPIVQAVVDRHGIA